MEACFAEIEGLCASLSDEQWQVQSLCPDWTVRETIGHTVGVEDALLGWEVSTDNPPAFAKMLKFTAEAPNLSSAAFAARVGEILDARRAELASLSDDDMSVPSFTPVGVQTYGRFMAIRIFDLWVHVRDCTIPLGLSGDDFGPGAEITLEEIEGSIGFIVGKKIGLPDGMSLRVDVTGPLARSIAVVVDGRARAVDPADLESPDVVLTVDSTNFIMLGCGRVDPQQKIDAGEITWSGDPHWGETAARSLAFTM